MKQLINKYLKKFGVELHGTGYLQSLAKGEFKKDAYGHQFDYIGKKHDVVIFDIGANRGDTVQKYLDYYPSATVYAFEPFPETFETLQTRFSKNKSVHCYPFAISNIKSEQVLFVNKSADTNSLFKPQKAGLSSDKEVENKGTIRVPTITIDLFCSENNIRHIDILKMDIQGGELNALKGAENLLTNKLIDLIYSEVFFIEQYESQAFFHDISGFLFQHNYCLQDLYDPFYGKGHLVWADAIFTQ
jgi:FkbM family methyltransferase